MFFAVKVAGVPRDVTESDVRSFFSDCTIDEVVFDGERATVIYVKLVSQEDFNKACAHDGHPMRWQKVEVTCALQSEYEAVQDKNVQVCVCVCVCVCVKTISSYWHTLLLPHSPFSLSLSLSLSLCLSLF